MEKPTRFRSSGRVSGRAKRTEDVTTVAEAESVRGDLFQDFSRVLTTLHAEDTPFEDIRELNERANALLRARRAWEHRIKELGGPDHLRGAKMAGSVAVNGYRYFGRARELPDVVAMLEKKKQEEKDVKETVDAETESLRKRDALNAVILEEGYYGDNACVNRVKSEILMFDELGEAPSLSQIEAVVVERKKAQLLARLEAKRAQENV